MEQKNKVLCFCIIISFLILCVTETAINIYIPHTIIDQLLGFDGQFYYVRDNVVMQNALQHQLVIPEHMNSLQIKWRDEHDKPFVTLSERSKYKMKLFTHGSDVMESMSVNIPSDGFLPVLFEEEIGLNLTCKKKVTGSADINLHLNISTNLKKVMLLQFNFLKKCYDTSVIENENEELILQFKREEENYFEEYEKAKSSSEEDSDSEDMVTTYFFVSVGGVCSLVVLAATGIAFLHVQAMPKMSDEQQTNIGSMDSSMEQQTKTIIPEVVRATLAEQKQQELLHRLKDFTIRRNLLSLANTIQEGSFGRAYVGNLVNAECGEELKVLVKTITDSATPDQVMTFIHESSVLKRANHRNVLPLMHLCVESERIPLMIYPYVNRGNLKNYVRLTRTAEPLAKTLTTRDIVLMSLQIAKGLQYIHRRRMFHKDVATRNCVVDEDLHVKIADTALARDFFPGDYHSIGEANENRPIRWMAVESLEHNEFTFASDVWSYGVLLWELSSLAQTPYASVDPFEMLTYLQSGLRLPQPLHCPDDYFALMACCWALSPDDRLHLSQIIAGLEAFLNTLSAFI